MERSALKSVGDRNDAKSGRSTRKPRRKRSTVEIAVLVSSYNKPKHLRRVLVSLATQRGVQDHFEVVVTDDGSSQPCREVVDRFAAEVPFRVKWVTHPHAGFQLARCRNEGVAESSADYLLFLDGDCVVPPDHLRAHLDLRQPGWVLGGYCCRLSSELSERIDERMIRESSYVDLVPPTEFKKLRRRHRKAVLYRLVRHPSRPKLAGGNIAIARDDYERVNGYDENFVGWGAEDDDLRRRLAAVGMRVGSVLHRTLTYHLWHPPDPAVSLRYRDRPNGSYIDRPGRLVRCRRGLVKRRLADIATTVVGRPPDGEAVGWLAKFLPHVLATPQLGTRQSTGPEIELLFARSGGRFSGHADCNIWLDLGGKAIDRRGEKQRRRAHLALSEDPIAGMQPGETQFDLSESKMLLDAIC